MKFDMYTAAAAAAATALDEVMGKFSNMFVKNFHVG